MRQFARATPIATPIKKKRVLSDKKTKRKGENIEGIGSSSFSDSASATSSPTASPSHISNRQKKKRRYHWAPRDSLNSRLQVGRPGSRRFIRWEHEFVLVQLLSDTESDMSEDELDYDSTAEPSPGLFGQLFYEVDSAMAFEPLLDTTEELQSAFLEHMDHSRGREIEIDFQFDQVESAPSRLPQGLSRRPQGVSRPPQGHEFMNEDVMEVEGQEGTCALLYEENLRFSSLSRRHQRVLRKHRNSASLQEIVSIVHDFTASPQAEAPLFCSFAFSQSFDRLLVHAVAEFYHLTSYTRDDDLNADGTPLTVVRRRNSSEGQCVDLRVFLSTLDLDDNERED